MTALHPERTCPAGVVAANDPTFSLPRELGAPPRTARTDAAGSDPDRLLLVGGGMIGGDLPEPDRRLARRVARHLAQLTGRGATVVEAVDPSETTDGILGVIRRMRLERFDAIVMTADSTLVGTAVRATTRRTALRRFVMEVLAHATPSTQIVLSGVDPRIVEPSLASVLAGGTLELGRRVNAECAEVAAEFDQVEYVPIHDTSQVAGPSWGSEDWCDAAAQRLAVHLALRMDAVSCEVPGSPRWHRDRPLDETERQAAVDASGVTELPHGDTDLSQLVALAARIYDVEFAAVEIVDHDRVVVLAAHGFDVDEAPRQDAFCDLTIQHARPHVIGDALTDEHWNSTRHVTRPPHLRFYAGVPLEATHGERLGAFCVFGTQPRDAASIDMDRLRDLALLAQRRLAAMTNA